MSKENYNPSIQAEQIDIIRKKPSLNCQPEQNYQNDQNELQNMKACNQEPIFFEVPKVEQKLSLYDIIVVKQIESKQLGKLIHASHQLGGVFLFIVNAVKILGLNKFTVVSFTIAILIIISSLLWIFSVAIGTIGIKRQKYNSLIFYFLGITVSFFIEFSSTIVILATNHIADHQLGIYNKNVVIRIIIFMTLEFMVVLYQLLMLRSVGQIRQLFIDIERLQTENQSNNDIEIQKML
ncbi:unnamed protein product [Paramecium octaurelia]|uniref:Transmembrane protein n=1 Tax=Paramecium octaurelia TaxID=43137 RepID=A0A8S1VJF0_PAROT|nr:unnamed protein product [Paramecium octaurelia]